MSLPATLTGFPGTLYDSDGTRLAGDGPEFTPELDDSLPHKALIRDRAGEERVAIFEAGDRLWLLPDSLGTPPELPMPLLAELAEVVRRGNSVALAARNPEVYALVRNTLVLLLDDSGGRWDALRAGPRSTFLGFMPTGAATEAEVVAPVLALHG